MSTPSLRLARQELFKTPSRTLTEDQHIALGYERARASAAEYGLTAEDIVHLTPKFWSYHMDLVHTVSFATFVLVTIQYNLAAGTMGPFAATRPDLQRLMDRILNFEVSSQIHAPHHPDQGLPRVGVVMARLMVAGEDRGLRPFIVWLNDGYRMHDGISSKKLPNRTGSRPIDHSVTTFDHVRLPSSALLGSLEKPHNMREHFLSVIWRVAVGTLGLSSVMVPVMKRSVYVAGKYSMRRHVQGNDGKPTPIISFRTQQRPILHTLAQIAVFEPYAHECFRRFMQSDIKPTVRHGIAATMKAVLNSATQSSLYGLAERCGAQGLFEYNHIIQGQLETRGISIAEGDILALCIRRYSMPVPRDPSSLLARHEKGLFDECLGVIKDIKGGHRNVEFNNAILPRCQPLIEAMGQRMAYEAAAEAGAKPELLQLYEAGVVLQDSSWYVQHAGLTREAQFENESRALDACLPQLEQMLDNTGAKDYTDSPLLSQETWDTFVASLETFEPPTRRVDGWNEEVQSPQVRSRL
ncbi:acyl-CoA dehydrogenase/oxidase [Penicillium capsulatum]|uniref:Acyl-CoA dehydrogenase/oxidase n=1 Tax=Penicillium capsulatum TaxID=69766 RepID=A0A9W9LGL0_9EURO|nr:acyl-CoA dehydrogenase/oxidase [Penicillium capsulatum]